MPMTQAEQIRLLKQKVKELERENSVLKKQRLKTTKEFSTVHVPNELKHIFNVAEKKVRIYFKQLKLNPEKEA
jgi:hypothetical protein